MVGPGGLRGFFVVAGPCLLLGTLLLSGCAAPVTDAAIQSGAFPAPFDPSRTDVLWDGKFAATVCAPIGVESCMGKRVGDQVDRVFLDVAEPRRAQLRMEWDSAAGGLEELTLWLDAVTEKPSSCAGCHSYRFRVLGKVTGASPLDLAIDPILLEPGERLAILARPVQQTPGPVYAEAYGAQPFRVTGWIESDGAP